MNKSVIIEGIWEDVKLRDAELAGHQVRVIIKDKTASVHPIRNKKNVSDISRPSLMGRFAGILSTEDYFRSKQEEIELEDRKFI